MIWAPEYAISFCLSLTNRYTLYKCDERRITRRNFSLHTQTLKKRNDWQRGIAFTYLNIVCTATMVLQSASESSSAELDSSLFTTTTFSANVIPARNRSSKLKHFTLNDRENMRRDIRQRTNQWSPASNRRVENRKWHQGRRYRAAVPAAKWSDSGMFSNGNGHVMVL